MVFASGRPVLEDRSGQAVAEVRRLPDGSVVLTDRSSGAKRRIVPAELVALGRE